ncbi:hypothetical protein RKD29_003231 [Streptomyces tendae]
MAEAMGGSVELRTESGNIEVGATLAIRATTSYGDITARSL